MVKNFCRSTGGAADSGHRGVSFGVMCLGSMFGSSEVSCFMDYIFVVAKPLRDEKMKLVLVCNYPEMRLLNPHSIVCANSAFESV